MKALVSSVRSVSVDSKPGYYNGILGLLEGRLRSIVTSEVTRATPTHPAVVSALTRSLLVYQGVACADPGVDRFIVWVSLFPALELCPQLADTYLCDGSVAMAALSLFLKFSDAHVRLSMRCNWFCGVAQSLV